MSNREYGNRRKGDSRCVKVNNNCEKRRQASNELKKLFYHAAIQAGYHPLGKPIDLRLFPKEIRKRLRKLYFQTGWGGMNLCAVEDDKVICVEKNAGFTRDIKNAEKYLEKGAVYTIKTTFVSDSFSFVMLKEFPGIKFNTVFFDNYIN